MEDIHTAWPRVLAVVTARALLALLIGLLLWALVPALFGWRTNVVMSGSMRPHIQVGDLVVTRPVSVDDLAPGQVVLVTDRLHPDRPLMHRLVRETPDGRLILRGDANKTADSDPVGIRDVRGVAVLRIPALGLPVVAAQQHHPTDLVLALAGLVVLVVVGCSSLRPVHPRRYWTSVRT
jgi:signal peptidase